MQGMMNNCWFRVKFNVCKPHKGEIGVMFEHPAQPGNQSGGWMARQAHVETTESAQTLKKSMSAPFMNTSTTQYSMAEVHKHSTRDSAWIVVHGHVYDCTSFLKDHPGGTDSILINAGTDCTEEFDAIHSDKAKTLLDMYRIGELSALEDSSNALNLTTISENSKGSAVALANPREKVQCKLVYKENISHDVRLFRFALPSSDQVLGLPVGKHIFVYATIDGKICMRAYTPTSPGDTVGHFDLVIKIYFKGENPNSPNGGLLSQHLESLPIGSTIDIKGPTGHIEYTGCGKFAVDGKNILAKRLAMIAGGTGITPVYQVIQAVLRNQPEDTTEMHLVYANRTEDDILLREELDRLAREYPNRLKVWYVVSRVKRVEEEWRYSVGRINESILREHVPAGGPDTVGLICGPPQMIKAAVLPNLEKMNYDITNSCFVF